MFQLKIVAEQFTPSLSSSKKLKPPALTMYFYFLFYFNFFFDTSCTLSLLLEKKWTVLHILLSLILVLVLVLLLYLFYFLSVYLNNSLLLGKILTLFLIENGAFYSSGNFVRVDAFYPTAKRDPDEVFLS